MAGTQLGPMCLVCGVALFVTGLAAFAMGQAIVLSLPRGRELPLARHFRYLGIFALLQSLAMWLNAAKAWGVITSRLVGYGEICLSIVAAAFLLQFGCSILLQHKGRYLSWLRWSPLLLGTGCLAVAFWDPSVPNWGELARSLALVTLYLPGAALAAVAFLGLRSEMRAVHLKTSDWDAQLVSAAFIAHAAVIGLVILPSGLMRGLFPMMLTTLAPPVTVLALAVSVMRFLRLFDLEVQRRVSSLEKERKEAIERAEAAQEYLMKEIARLGAQLETIALPREGHTSLEERGIAQWLQSLQAIAVARERERISQELHDGMAQMLGYIDLRIQAARRAVLAGRMSEATLTLQEVEWVVQKMQGEMRESILELRCGAARDDMLVCLSQYLSHFQERWGIMTELVVEDADALELSPLVELQLLRVIQESLRNVRQHAEAQHIWITFRIDGDTVAVTIEDDGRGFDPEDVKLGHFGLHLMRERCESVRGTLHIESAVGQGTKIEARFPMGSRGGEEQAGHEANYRINRR